MPLKDGCDHLIVGKNVAELIRKGHPQDQAVAIALEHARKQGCDLAKIHAQAKARRNA